MVKRKASFTLAFAMMFTVLLSSFAYLQFVSPVHADSSSWYQTVNGVLSSDYYSLYPYANQSVDIGVSKFGEMISQVGSLGVGLQYPGYDVVGTYDQHAGTSADPFANDKIAQNLWLNGWYMDIRYTHRTLRDRKIEAMAMYADMITAGGDWLNGHNFTMSAAPNGGRKTTGYATTDPMTTLYNGPRRYIVLCTNHLYDWYDANGDGIVQVSETWPVVDLLLTFDFDKVNKQVTIYKDVKIVISGKELDSPLDIQFSDREEWDLGPAPDYASYAHFYHQELSTVYGANYSLAPGIFREYDYKGTGPITGVPVWDSRDPFGPSIVLGSVRVYVNSAFWQEGVDYNINYDTGEITWLSSVLQTDKVEVVYKLRKYEGPVMKPSAQSIVPHQSIVPYTGVPNEYDVAQIISSDFNYVGWKAFWPTLSDYTVMGWSKTFEPLINVSQPDILPKEPDIPFVIGEWDFMLGKGYPNQFRGVEVCGLTDRHDADDINHTGSLFNNIDREAKYQLDMVFNPWDLESAVHKKASRWVEFVNITSIDETFTTDIDNVPVIVKPDPMSFYVQIGPNDYIPDPTEWDQYSVFSERIIMNSSILLMRGVDYDIVQNSDGTATITFYVTGRMKILYSAMGMYATTQDNENNALTGVPDGDMGVLMEAAYANAPIEFNIFTDAFPTTPDEVAPWFAKLKIHALNVNLNHLDTPETDAVYLNGYLCGILTGTGNYGIPLEYSWTTSEFNVPPNYMSVSGKQLVQIFVDCKSLNLPANITLSDPTTWPATGTGFSWAVEVDWGQLVFMPRYEWVIVGRDAKTVDSAGSALASAAFKDKQVEIGNAGEDMADPTLSNQIPNVMAKFGTGSTMADYEDSMGRSALIDDWCHTWAVSSGDLITVGGPLINTLTYYANDFEEAIYGIQSYTPYGPWQGAVIALSCWSKDHYFSNSTYGYAVIDTYLDINGTVIFTIWGVWGRDTFYACKFFHDEIIYELQEFLKGATSTVVQIGYKDPMHPTFTIPEVLGTISETQIGLKGGIHPDP
jgi:hypothetical protein